MSNIQVVPTQVDHVDGLEAVQRVVFAHLPDFAQYTASMYRHHLNIFPDGQFTALTTEHGKMRVVGGTTTCRLSDFDHVRRRYSESTAWLDDHEPDGDWLYGVDISVHPDYRRRGIASQLYAARAELVRRLNLRGEVAAGLLPGYHRHPHLTVHQYVEKIVTGELTDPTLSMQMSAGFVIRDVLIDYVDDPNSGNCAVLIVRENPHHSS